MPPRASILRSQWRPGGPSETPRAYFGSLGGDVGAPGSLLEAPRRALWSSRGGLGTPRERSRDHFGNILGRFWEGFWTIFFVRGGRQTLALCWSFSNAVFMVFPELPKMAEIVPNREIQMNLQHFVSRSSFRISLEPWQNGVGKGLNFK